MALLLAVLASAGQIPTFDVDKPTTCHYQPLIWGRDTLLRSNKGEKEMITIFAYCHYCEDQMMVEYDRIVLGRNPKAVLEIVSCGKCRKVLNSEGWIKLTKSPVVQKEVKASWFWAFLFTALPQGWIGTVNKAIAWLSGSYLVPAVLDEVEVPEIVESALVQLERISGEKYEGRHWEDLEEYLRRCIRIALRAKEVTNA